MVGFLLKGIPKLAKKGWKRTKEDLPFAGLVGAIEAGKHGYNIATGKKDIHEGTITGITKKIKKAIKKKTKKDKD